MCLEWWRSTVESNSSVDKVLKKTTVTQRLTWAGATAMIQQKLSFRQNNNSISCRGKSLQEACLITRNACAIGDIRYSRFFEKKTRLVTGYGFGIPGVSGNFCAWCESISIMQSRNNTSYTYSIALMPTPFLMWESVASKKIHMKHRPCCCRKTTGLGEFA